ncbi:MAG: hypothetical protein HWD60_06075 [Defluviicoccus sp.]|nr:MAG: hypothetical protein HWD60_06075 [Defluviicoccus sp.]
MKVVNCTIVNGWDDAIAVHVPRDVTDEGRRWGALIADNQIVQAHGIKVLGVATSASWAIRSWRRTTTASTSATTPSGTKAAHRTATC